MTAPDNTCRLCLLDLTWDGGHVPRCLLEHAHVVTFSTGVVLVFPLPPWRRRALR